LNAGAQKRLFVLDTNVLMHDPTALFRFAEHDIFLPMVVLEELDKGKKGMSEVARNVRQASRFLDDLVAGKEKVEIDRGLAALHRDLFLEANPIPVKWALAEMGRIPEGIRLPLTWLSEPYHEPVRQALRQAGVI